MICRLWSGATRLEKGDEYLEYLRKTGVQKCLDTPGNEGVLVLRMNAADRSRFLFISLWKSMEVIKGFAGDDVSKAVFFPEDKDYLFELNPIIEHYELKINETPPHRRQDHPVKGLASDDTAK